jgi:hypothetical protein
MIAGAAQNLAPSRQSPTLVPAMVVPRRSDRYVSRNISGETFVVPVRAGVANLEAIFTLNGVGSAIWQQIDGKKSIAELAHAITVQFKVTEAEATADVSAFVELLASKGLIEDAGAVK